MSPPVVTNAQELIETIRFNAQGLVPVVVQEDRNKQVLMLAWASKHSLQLTLSEGRPVYWSRSRQQLWRKGETSGNTQQLVQALIDCDKDTLLFKVRQTGPACHTGKPDCFFETLMQDTHA